MPGEFVDRQGEVRGRLDIGMAGLLLTWIEWVDVEVRGFPGLLEDLRRLKGDACPGG